MKYLETILAACTVPSLNDAREACRTADAKVRAETVEHRRNLWNPFNAELAHAIHEARRYRLILAARAATDALTGITRPIPVDMREPLARAAALDVYMVAYNAVTERLSGLRMTRRNVRRYLVMFALYDFTVHCADIKQWYSNGLADIKKELKEYRKEMREMLDDDLLWPDVPAETRALMRIFADPALNVPAASC